MSMSAAAHPHGHAAHEHHELPTSGRALTAVALSATLHCLTGLRAGRDRRHGRSAPPWACRTSATIVVSIALAFAFGYGLTSLPLLRAGLALAAVVPIALASDTLSIATMEVVDNAIVATVPGALDAGLGDLLFWGSLSFSLAVAGRGRAPGQPVAAGPRQGPRRGAPHRDPRRPLAPPGRAGGRGRLRLRRRVLAAQAL